MGLFSVLQGQPPSYEKKKHYTFGRTLGAGTYGVVRQAVHDKFGQVAVKIITKKTVKGHEDMVFDEIQMLEGLDHPHIIHLKEHFESNTKFYVTTTLATGGELFDRICQLGKFTESDAVTIIRQVLEALKYLHERNIVHRDLKPENLLYMTPEQDSQLVLADFGIAKVVAPDGVALRSMAGSYGYAAPEILERKGHSFPADLWSLGVVTYTILCGYSPFRSEERDELIAETIRAEIVFHEKYWRDVSEEAKLFILSLLNPSPEKRPTSAAALADVWITGKTAKQSDLLPQVSKGFNARRKFRRAVEMVKLANRLKALEVSSDDEEAGVANGSRKSSTSGSLAVPDTIDGGSSPDGERRLSSQGRRFRSNSAVFAEVVKAKVRDAKQEAEERNLADAETMGKP
ncbi:Calmodulin-dependent protein kinase cmk2 [Savitreella phatthalungensis]